VSTSNVGDVPSPPLATIPVPELVFWAAPVRLQDLATQVRLAATYGFTAVALQTWAFRRFRREGLAARDLIQLCDNQGVNLLWLEAVTDWTSIRVPAGVHGELRERFDISQGECLAMCDELGIRNILAAAGFDRGTVSLAEQIDGFGALCDRAASKGIRVDLEFMPIGGVPDLGAAWRIVSEVGRSNGRILVDTWHFCKSQSDLDLLDVIPGNYLANLQIADGWLGQRGASITEDAVRHRLEPGQGELPIIDVMSRIAAKGYLESVGPEIYSEEMDNLDPSTAVSRSLTSMQTVATQVGISLP
jgi:sugar phosphate isomerase/epimerase